jgi:hypothetical protein
MITHDDLIDEIGLIFEKCGKLAINKGNEYSNGDADMLANIRELAENNCVSPERMCVILCSKHFHSLEKHVDDFGFITMEDKAMDIINYLIMGLIFRKESMKGER